MGSEKFDTIGLNHQPGAVIEEALSMSALPEGELPIGVTMSESLLEAECGDYTFNVGNKDSQITLNMKNVPNSEGAELADKIQKSLNEAYGPYQSFVFDERNGKTIPNNFTPEDYLVMVLHNQFNPEELQKYAVTLEVKNFGDTESTVVFPMKDKDLPIENETDNSGYKPGVTVEKAGSNLEGHSDCIVRSGDSNSKLVLELHDVEDGQVRALLESVQKTMDAGAKEFQAAAFSAHEKKEERTLVPHDFVGDYLWKNIGGGILVKHKARVLIDDVAYGKQFVTFPENIGTDEVEKEDIPLNYGSQVTPELPESGKDGCMDYKMEVWNDLEKATLTIKDIPNNMFAAAKTIDLVRNTLETGFMTYAYLMTKAENNDTVMDTKLEDYMKKVVSDLREELSLEEFTAVLKINSKIDGISEMAFGENLG